VINTIAITGSRKYHRLDLVRRLVVQLLPPQSTIITGNDQGVETTVIETSCWPDDPLHKIQVIHPCWTLHKNAAKFIQQQQMIAQSQILIIFHHNNQCEDLIKHANAKNLMVYAYDAQGKLQADQPFLWQPDGALCLPDMSGPEYAPQPRDIALDKYS